MTILCIFIMPEFFLLKLSTKSILKNTRLVPFLTRGHFILFCTLHLIRCIILIPGPICTITIFTVSTHFKRLNYFILSHLKLMKIILSTLKYE